MFYTDKLQQPVGRRGIFSSVGDAGGSWKNLYREKFKVRGFLFLPYLRWGVSAAETQIWARRIRKTKLLRRKEKWPKRFLFFYFLFFLPQFITQVKDKVGANPRVWPTRSPESECVGRRTRLDTRRRFPHSAGAGSHVGSPEEARHRGGELREGKKHRVGKKTTEVGKTGGGTNLKRVSVFTFKGWKYWRVFFLNQICVISHEETHTIIKKTTNVRVKYTPHHDFTMSTEKNGHLHGLFSVKVIFFNVKRQKRRHSWDQMSKHSNNFL